MGKVIFNNGRSHDSLLLGGKPPEFYLARPNLLRNPTFRINQRGQEVYNQTNISSYGNYAVDGFMFLFSLEDRPDFEIRPLEHGMHLKITKSANWVNYQQYIIHSEVNLQSQVVTLSLEVKRLEGQFGLVLQVVDKSSKWHAIKSIAVTQAGLIQSTMQLIDDIDRVVITFEFNGKLCDMELSHIKLEIGSQFSGFHPLPYEMELLKCQRYYQVHSRGDIPPQELSPPMRINPRVSQRPDGLWAYDAEL